MRRHLSAVVTGAGTLHLQHIGAKPGQGRRGEEAYITRKLAEIGMPILRTIHAAGLFEGGSFCWLNEHTALAGLSYRQNEEGARQIEEKSGARTVTLAPSGSDYVALFDENLRRLTTALKSK